MELLSENPFYETLTNVKYSTEQILEIWTHLLDKNVSGFQNRNLMVNVCKRDDINLLLFMMQHNFKFDKLAIYVLAFSENIHFIEMLFEYQTFNDLNFVHLKKQLVKKKLYQMVEFFKSY
jgi:hypothetical protein